MVLRYLLTELLTHSLYGAVLLKKLTGSQLVKKSPAFYGNRKFITVFSRPTFILTLRKW